MIRATTFLTALVLVYAVTFVVADELRFEPVKDEIHFHETARTFAAPFSLAELRSYPEVVTPLALVTWGLLERVTSSGLWAGRFLDLVLSFGLVALIGLGWPALWPRGALAAVGLLVFPYTLALSVHLYTDVMAAALAGLGTYAVLRRKPLLAFAAFSAAISTRQYLVQIPAALAAAEAIACLRGEWKRWPLLAACAGSASTLFGWVLFFGGLAPQAGLDVWLPRYPDPMMHPAAFLLSFALYALTGVGVYFVAVEAILFRKVPARELLLAPRTLLVAAALALLFALDPPLLSATNPGGLFGRASRWLLPSPAFDTLRLALYYVFALIAALRFSRRLDAAFWVVAAGVVLATKQQLPWEKYLLPTLSTLWLLRAAGELPAYGEGERTAST